MTVEEFDAAKVGDRIYTKTNKFVVVYRNKTKLYLKSSGTDLLIFLDRGYSILRNYDLIPKGMDDSERQYYYQKRYLEKVLDTSKRTYQYWVNNLTHIKDEIKHNQRCLQEYEFNMDIYRTDYEKTKREYEDFCKAHGFMEGGVGDTDA